MNIITQNYICNSKETSKSIRDAIYRNDRVEIIATTGSGKTTYIDNILCTSTIKPVVIVPFKVISKIYKNCTVIDTNSTEDDLTTESMVMVIDQAVKYWDYIKNRTLIIDEAHCLITESTYRNAVLSFVEKVREIEYTKNGPGKKLIAFTATPCIEHILMNMTQVRIPTTKRPLNIRFIGTNSVDNAIAAKCAEHVDDYNYTKIFVLDNSYIDKAYRKLINVVPKTCIDYMKSDTIDTSDISDIIADEKLHNRYTLSTKVALNGLNFNNENESILIITSLYPGRTTYIDIIQLLGRLRKSSNTVDVIIYYDKALKYTAPAPLSLCKSSVSKVEVIMNDNYNTFIESQSSIEGIVSSLKDYYQLHYTNTIIDMDTKIKAVKKSDSFKELLKEHNDFLLNMSAYACAHPDIVKYMYTVDRWIRVFQHHVVRQTLLAMYKGGNIATKRVFELCGKYFQICIMNDKEFAAYVSNLSRSIEYICMHPTHRLMIQRDVLVKDYNMAIQWRDDMKNGVYIYNKINSDVATTKKSTGKIGGKIGGKISSPKKAVTLRIISTGEIKKFDSKTECMEFLGVGPVLFSKWIKGTLPPNSQKLKDFERII